MDDSVRGNTIGIGSKDSGDVQQIVPVSDLELRLRNAPLAFCRAGFVVYHQKGSSATQVIERFISIGRDMILGDLVHNLFAIKLEDHITCYDTIG